MLKKVLFCIIAVSVTLIASDLKVAAGAGYKKPLMEVIKEYEKSGKKIDAFFGNMRQVTTQAKQTNMSLIIGDKKFLSKKSNLKFNDYIKLGEGKVVLAYAKDKKINSINDLSKKYITRISMPQPKKAIYGIAGKEFLINSNLEDKVRDKLYIVATVPQSMTYVITNEVDVGIVNLTAALANKDKIGGYIEVPQKYYTNIEIVAGKLNACETKECRDFVNFLQNNTSKKIFEKYGL